MRAPNLVKIAAALMCIVPTPAASGETEQTLSTDVYDPGVTALTVDNQQEGLSNFVDRTVSVTGEGANILGPRLFTIDAGGVEPDRDAIVYVPPPAVAPVHERTPVTVTGVVRTVASIDISREWGSLETSLRRTVDQRERAVIVADSLTSGGTTLQAGYDYEATGGTRVGSRMIEPPLSDVDALANIQDEQFVGRTVRVRNVRISAIAPRGRWIAAADEQLFVLPGDETHVRPRQHVNISGVVLALPEQMKQRLGDYLAAQDEAIYVYARQLRVM